MQEALIVIPDLYFPQEMDRPAAGELALPGLEHLARFGERRRLGSDWRPWLARWAGNRQDMAELAPAAVAAAAVQSAIPVAGAAATASATVWMATPVHLVASLTTVHLDRRSVLYLEASELLELATDFERTFRGSGHRLVPLEGGALVLLGPATASVDTREPARAMAGDVAEGLPSGPGAAALRQLGAEIEMWLHGHALNEARERRGELAVTSLWLWGGGMSAALPARQAAETQTAAPMAFGSDAYVRGLWSHMGAQMLPLPPQFAQVLRYPDARGAVLVVEAGRMLQPNRNWTWPEAVAEIDRRFLLPAVQALHRGALGEIQLLANDWCLSLRARHRLRLWRRKRPGLSGLL
ncbi:MAG TPA: hypothetical protein VGL55_17815 [Steroidobacteraceae bacterium]|jgi:hypothetical protein